MTPAPQTASPAEATKAALLAALEALPLDDPRMQHLAELLLPPPAEDEVWARHRPIVEARQKAWDVNQSISLEELKRHMAQRKSALSNASPL
jgi:hypothetical protein